MSSVSLRMIVLEGCRFEFIWVQKKVGIHLGAKKKNIYIYVYRSIELFNFGGAGVTVAVLFLMRVQNSDPLAF